MNSGNKLVQAADIQVAGYECFTEQGVQLSKDAESALWPVAKKYLDEGYGISDIQYILFQTISYISLRHLAETLKQ